MCRLGNQGLILQWFEWGELMAKKTVDYKALGERIQKRRRQLGMSQQLASEKLNLSTSFFSRVERGEKVASLETIIKIANAFDMSLDFLLMDSLKKNAQGDLPADIAQIFTDKSPAQAQRLAEWLKVLSDNIDRL